MMRNRIVFTKGSGVQGRLIRESKLTLKTAPDMGRSCEESQKQLQKLGTGKEHTGEEEHYSQHDMRSLVFHRQTRMANRSIMENKIV